MVFCKNWIELITIVEPCKWAEKFHITILSLIVQKFNFSLENYFSLLKNF